jgi:transposase
MKHVGLDVHLSQTCVYWQDDDSGESSRARLMSTREVPRHLRQLGEVGPVVLETGVHSKFLARQLAALHFDVYLADAYKTALQMPSYKTSKTDRLDARALCAMSREQAVHKLRVWIPDEYTEQLRHLVRSREGLVQITTSLRAQIRGLLAGWGEVCPAHDLMGQQGRAWLDQVPERLPHEAQQDPRCQLLQTLPGCGPLTAVTIIAEIGDPGRFANSSRLCSYVGLAPTIRQSGERSYTGPLKARGNPHLRRILVLLAQHFSQRRDLAPHPLRRRYYRVLRQQRPNPAKTALARDLCRVLLAMLQTHQPFELNRQAA